MTHFLKWSFSPICCLLLSRCASQQTNPDRHHDAKLALEYVNRVQVSECTGGTEETIRLYIDHIVWDKYAVSAINLANFLTKVLLRNNNTLDSLDDVFLFSLVRNNVEGNTLIFGSAIAVNRGVYSKHGRFCPYAFKKNGTVRAHDIAINYDYLDPSTEWYDVLRSRNWDNVTTYTDIVSYRNTSSESYPPVEIGQPVADLTDGHWTYPYFDCGGGDIWMVTYSSPVFGLEPNTQKPVFKGVATIDIELTSIDIDQCDPDLTAIDWQDAGAFDFRGTHKCHSTTKCFPLHGYGFVRGAYMCRCKDGYFFPNESGTWNYNGLEIERYYDDQVISEEILVFHCTPCAPGCTTCVDFSPCLYEWNVIVRSIILLITLLTVIFIGAISTLIYLYRGHPIIKSASPMFLHIMCAGGVLMCLEMFFLYEKPTNLICIMRIWPEYVGFSLMYGALLLKTWRISVIFRVGTMKKIYLPDRALAQRLAPIVLVVSGYLLAWCLAEPSTVHIIQTSSTLKYPHCSSNWWEYALRGAQTLFLLLGVYYCYTVRKAPSFFNESKYITWSTYNAIIVGTFIIITTNFIAAPAGPDVVYLMNLLYKEVVVTITMCIVFGPKFYAIYRNTSTSAQDTDTFQTSITARMNQRTQAFGTQIKTKKTKHASVQTTCVCVHVNCAVTTQVTPKPDKHSLMKHLHVPSNKVDVAPHSMQSKTHVIET